MKTAIITGAPVGFAAGVDIKLALLGTEKKNKE